MSDQSFDTNIAAFQPTGAPGNSIPIPRQLESQSYLSNVQNQKDKLLQSEVGEQPTPTIAPTMTLAHQAAPRGNRMDAFFQQAAEERAREIEEQNQQESLAQQGISQANTAQEEFSPQNDATQNHANEWFDDQPTPDLPSPDLPSPVLPQPAIPQQPVEAETFPQPAQPTEANNEVADSPATPQLETRQSQPNRLTGSAGLTAGIAAMGAAGLAQRLANTEMPFNEAASRLPSQPEPQPELDSPIAPLPTVPSITGKFDLEAARLENLSGPVFSQEFDPRDLTPEDRLAQRLERENQLLDSPQGLNDPTPPLVDSQAAFASTSAPLVPQEIPPVAPETPLPEATSFPGVDLPMHPEVESQFSGAPTLSPAGFADPTSNEASFIADSSPVAIPPLPPVDPAFPANEQPIAEENRVNFANHQSPYQRHLELSRRDVANQASDVSEAHSLAQSAAHEIADTPSVEIESFDAQWNEPQHDPSVEFNSFEQVPQPQTEQQQFEEAPPAELPPIDMQEVEAQAIEMQNSLALGQEIDNAPEGVKNDPRVSEAMQLEQQFRQQQLQDQESLDTRLQLQRFERERIETEQAHEAQQRVYRESTESQLAAEDELQSDSQTAPQTEDEDQKQAAIIQAERVKLVREKVNSQQIELAQNTDQGIDQSNNPSTHAPMPLSEPMAPEIDPAVSSEALDLAIYGTQSPVQGSVAEQDFKFDLFYACSLEHLTAGVIFVDHNQRVKMWSKAAEKATGIVPEVVLGRPLLPQTFNLSNGKGIPIQLERCPIAEAIQSLKIVSGDYRITSSTSHDGLKVELTVIPVIDQNRYVNGAVILFHDRSVQINLKRQLRDLYNFSVLDPLTQVANRAEFERVQQEYIAAFQQSDNFNCSIIICDIDFFKSINDKFGHAVGDQALVAFAKMLKRFVRAQDLVARYGGEEFIILCADCDTAAAIQRAEEIRMALYKTPQPMLDGKSISASFGVSELRAGDTAMDFFVRADTALLKAKEKGRNRVVASDGSTSVQTDQDEAVSASGVRWRNQRQKENALVCEEFRTDAPMQVLIAKLRGFIIEKEAKLLRVEPEFLSMELSYEDPADFSRKGVFTMNVEFKEREESIPNSKRFRKINFIRIAIYAGRPKKWFSTNHTDVAPHLLAEIRRYLMISDQASRVSIEMATENRR